MLIKSDQFDRHCTRGSTAAGPRRPERGGMTPVARTVIGSVELASRRHVDLLRTASAQCRPARRPRRARRPSLEPFPCPSCPSRRPSR